MTGPNPQAVPPGGVSYRAVRRRLIAERGPATRQPCAECGSAARFWCYDGTDPDERTDPAGSRYSVDLGRYRARCGSCHRTTAAGHPPLTGPAAARAVARYQVGASLRQIAAELGVTSPAVRAALTGRGVALRLRRRGTAVDGERAAELYAAGVSLRGIAELLGTSRPAVRAVLVARGVAIRPVGRPRRRRAGTSSQPVAPSPVRQPTSAALKTPPRVLFRPLPTTSRQPQRPSPTNPS